MQKFALNSLKHIIQKQLIRILWSLKTSRNDSAKTKIPVPKGAQVLVERNRFRSASPSLRRAPRRAQTPNRKHCADQEDTLFTKLKSNLLSKAKPQRSKRDEVAVVSGIAALNFTKMDYCGLGGLVPKIQGSRRSIANKENIE